MAIGEEPVAFFIGRVGWPFSRGKACELCSMDSRGGCSRLPVSQSLSKRGKQHEQCDQSGSGKHVQHAGI